MYDRNVCGSLVCTIIDLILAFKLEHSGNPSIARPLFVAYVLKKIFLEYMHHKRTLVPVYSLVKTSLTVQIEVLVEACNVVPITSVDLQHKLAFYFSHRIYG